MTRPRPYAASVAIPTSGDAELSDRLGDDYDADTARHVMKMKQLTHDAGLNTSATDQFLGTGTLTDTVLQDRRDAFGDNVLVSTSPPSLGSAC